MLGQLSEQQLPDDCLELGLLADAWLRCCQAAVVPELGKHAAIAIAGMLSGSQLAGCIRQTKQLAGMLDAGRLLSWSIAGGQLKIGIEGHVSVSFQTKS